MSSRAVGCIFCVGLTSLLTSYGARAETNNLKLNQEIIDNSPVLRRWLVEPPDILLDIYENPSFTTKLRLGLTSRDQSLGFDLGVVDLFLGRNSPVTISAGYQREFSGREADLNADLKYYVLPLGGYFNFAPQVGYRSIDFFGENVSGINIGVQGVLVLSPRSSDLRLSQTFTAPGSDRETSITTLSTSYALTNRLNIGSNIQWRRSPVRSDSRVGFYLEWRL
ncbi:hypothetical protein Syn7502_01741 [Synechococcus sp. PCC 7502]|uniref:hypothetical protein n=1 Tax=Synechococcus sp. PCC 7502 TaxID=1173263 RepID=UPI00029FBB93|nr:hypothetical protein [Synechococcus sp. PCC 7502]AFY73788.1 hypothetical protein Syn7502_01741 [Synechococcus sp. PCC 7502]